MSSAAMTGGPETWRRAAARALLLAGCLAGCLALAGCAAALRDKPLIGEPEQALRSAPAQRPPYLDLNMPGARASTAMTQEERAKVEAELADRRAKAVEERRKQIQQPSRPGSPD
ncbi:MAG: hypothetical protein IT538_09540 [Variibacter sp.]|nr:hypothetical protein [Variibacter sp.]